MFLFLKVMAINTSTCHINYSDDYKNIKYYYIGGWLYLSVTQWIDHVCHTSDWNRMLLFRNSGIILIMSVNEIKTEWLVCCVFIFISCWWTDFIIILKWMQMSSCALLNLCLRSFHCQEILLGPFVPEPTLV